MQESEVDSATLWFDVAEMALGYFEVLVWPAVVVFVVIKFKSSIEDLVARIKKASLPGGLSFDLEQKIEEVKKTSRSVKAQLTAAQGKSGQSIPVTEANERLIDLGLKPSPSGLDMTYYRDIAEQDTNLALAGLRIEVDVMARNLARGFDINLSEKESGARLIRKLFDQGAITRDQLNLALQIWSLASEAVHGQFVPYDEAQDIFDAAEVLADQYIFWLSWGFNDGWELDK